MTCEREVSMRKLVPIMALAALALALPTPAAAKRPAPLDLRAALKKLPEVDEKARRKAIDGGLAFLDKRLFKLPEPQGTPRRPFTFAVAGLVYLLDKRTRTGDRNPVGRIRAYLGDYVDTVHERMQDRSELPPRHGMAMSGRLIQYTWPIAQAGLFFGELHARGKHKRDARKTLEKIIAILAASQRENGGWGHGNIDDRAPEDGGGKSPFGDLEERFPELKGKLGNITKGGGGYPDTLVSSSTCVAATLGLLRGLLGEKAVESVPQARRYYRDARLGNGSFPYDPSQRSSGRSKTNVGRTAGALWAWLAIGLPRDRDFDRSLEYVAENLDFVKEGHGSPCLNVMHGAFFFRAVGPDGFELYRRYTFPRIIEAHQESGAFSCICEEKAFGVTCDSDTHGIAILKGGTDGYITAIHTLVLMLETDSLKILDRPTPTDPATPTTPSGPRHRR